MLGALNHFWFGNVLHFGFDLDMDALAKLYQAYSARFYLVYGGREVMRRSGLDESFLEPFRLIGAVVERVANE